MVEDRFYEPETLPFDELIEVKYEEYLEEMESEDGKPMTLEQYKEWYIGAW